MTSWWENSPPSGCRKREQRTWLVTGYGETWTVRTRAFVGQMASNSFYQNLLYTRLIDGLIQFYYFLHLTCWLVSYSYDNESDCRQRAITLFLKIYVSSLILNLNCKLFLLDKNLLYMWERNDKIMQVSFSSFLTKSIIYIFLSSFVALSRCVVNSA